MTAPGALPTREEIAEKFKWRNGYRVINGRTVVVQEAVITLEDIDALLARLRPAWEATTPEEIHRKLAAMIDEEERLMDRLEELGDTTYAVSDECVERTRKNLTVIMDLTQQRDALRADLRAKDEEIDRQRAICDVHIRERQESHDAWRKNLVAYAKLEADLRACAGALREVERHCPCGARPESPDTHPHVTGCPVGAALARAGVQEART